MQTMRGSRRWLISLASGASLSLSSCTTAPPPDPWAGIEPDTDLVAQPVALPTWPAPVAATEQTVTFDLAGARTLFNYQEASEGNYEIAVELSAQVTDLKVEADGLVAAGRAQRRVADLQREILQEERWHHAIEKATLWAAMLLVLIGVAVL